MSRSRLLILTLVVALMLGTIGSAFAQGNVLTVWADNTRAPAILDLADEVEAELGIQLEVVEVGFGDIRDQLLVAGPVGEGPDVLIGAHDWIGQFVVNGAIVPIELGDLADEFDPRAIDLFTYEGQLYGLPYALENVALIRNVDLVPEAPQTWEEVLEISEELQASGEADYGFLIRGGDFYHNYPIITAFGGYVFGRDETGEYDPSQVGLATEGGLASAQWMADMYSNNYSPPNVNDDTAFALFEDGEAAMFITGPWWIQRIQETGINYSIDPLPGSAEGMESGQPFLGGQGFFISAFSDNQLLAEIFLTEYVATTEFMQAVFERDPRSSAWLAVDTGVVPDAATFTIAGENAVPMPTIPEMSAVWSAAGNAMTLVSQGEDPEETFVNAQAQIEEAIGLMSSDARVVSAPGSYQDEAGCATDWDPGCDATVLQDAGDGTYTLTVTLPAGEYEFKISINKSWDENYGVDGVAGGDNIPLVVESEGDVTITYDDNTHTTEVTME